MYGNPIDALMGLINNQILLVSHQITMIEEVMSLGPSRKRTPVADHGSEEYSPPEDEEVPPINTLTPINSEDVTSFDDLEVKVKLDLLDLENCRLEISPKKPLHLKVMAITAIYLTIPDEENLAETGLLPMIDYLFEEANIGTTIFLDEGSNTSFIITKLAKALHLEGEVKLTMIFKAGEEIARPVLYKHHVVELKD